MTTEREQAIRDCIAALPYASDCDFDSDGLPVLHEPIVRARLEALLSAPDQAEASKPLTDLQRLGQEFDASPEAGTLCERTVRACIEAVPNKSGMCKGDVGAALLALIEPKPDKAKELVEAHKADLRDGKAPADVRDDDAWGNVSGLIRWLLDTGRLAE